ncbi:MAG: DUF2142 domain-containing protein [Oscillospiraceae bacterium]|nr:DUF2142 domain-containing protein [Oscillospiraceae bacterium]
MQLNWLLTLALFCLVVFASLKEAGAAPRLDKRGMWVAGLVCFGVAGLVAAACLTWTPINYEVIFGLQGRYLLPLLPLLMLMAGENPWLAAKKDCGRGLQVGAAALSSLALVNTLYLFVCL